MTWGDTVYLLPEILLSIGACFLLIAPVIGFRSGTSAAKWAMLVVLGAAYLLWLYQRVFWGPLDNPENAKVPDVNRRELGMMLALIALMVWIGVYPKPLFEIMEKPVDYVVQKVDPDYFAKEQLQYPATPAVPAADHSVANHSEVASK